MTNLASEVRGQRYFKEPGVKGELILGKTEFGCTFMLP
jgi:hypothetical protein